MGQREKAEANKPSKPTKRKWDRKHKIACVVGGIAAVIIVLLILFGTHVFCSHDWQPATCTEPETCSICGRTQGEPLGHTWVDATCTEPKTCEVCGATMGAPLGHDVSEWTVAVESTCTSFGEETGVCSRCGQEVTQQIPKTAHTPGDWVVVTDYTISSTGTVTPGLEAQYCTVCGQEVASRPYTTTLSTAQKNVLSKAASYLDFMSFSYSGLIDQLEYEGFTSDQAEYGVSAVGY